MIRGLLHLGLNVIAFRTLLHLGPNVITFRTLLHLGQLLHLGLQQGLLRSFLSPVLEATSTVAPRTKPSFPGCTSTILPNFQVLRFDFPSSITATISQLSN